MGGRKLVIDRERKRHGRAGRRPAVHQQFEPPGLQRIEPGIWREGENRRMVEGSYAVAAAGGDALILAGCELVCLAPLNHPKAAEPVCARKVIDKIIRAFRGDKYLPDGINRSSGARTKINRIVAAQNILGYGSRRREPRIDIDIGVIRAGERNIELAARSIGFAERSSDVVASDDLVDDRAFGDEIVP